MIPQEKAIADALAKRFIARPDVMAVQDHKGNYRPQENKFSYDVLADHIRGNVSLGHYLLSTDSECKLFAYDLDLTKTGEACEVEFGPNGVRILRDTARPCNPRDEWLDPDSPLRAHLALQLHSLADGLAHRIKRIYGFDAAVSYSGGKGLHVYAFCGKRAAADCRKMAVSILKGWNLGGDSLFEPIRGDVFWRRKSEEFKCVDVELFPKQDVLTKKEYGNLMRLPLGKHGRTGQRAFFIDLSTQPTRHDLFVEEDALLALTEGSIRNVRR